METQPIYKITELVGTSTTGIDDAIQHALARAATTLRNLDWFEVTDIRGQIAGGAVKQFQVSMKVGFRVEE